MNTILKTVIIAGLGYVAVKKLLPLLVQPVLYINNNNSGRGADDSGSGKTDPVGPPTPGDVDKTDPSGGSSPFFGFKPLESR